MANSAEKNSADYIRGSIATAALISKIPPDCTEEDILLIQAHYLGRKEGFARVEQLACVVNRLRIHKMNEDYLLAFELAKDILNEAK